jgi:hypothetical protein
MPAPSETYTEIGVGDLCVGAGLTETTEQTLRTNAVHAREAGYDPATHTPDEPHVHDGVGSAFILCPDMPNLVIDCQPCTEGNDALDEWSRTGVRFRSDDLNNAGLYFSASGQYATHVLGDRSRSKYMTGAGADLVLAIFARSRAPMADLTLNFGITDGHTSTFKTGTKASITQAQIGVGGYRRFYSLLSKYSATAHATDFRIGISTSGTFSSGGEVDVTCILVKPATILPWFEPSLLTRRHHNWELIGSGEVPVFDEEINFLTALGPLATV